ncbi:MAG TPA: SDR family oxidoreductase [Ignavibacteriaceae bacterium]|nr:SDR family oxidoreductase [Ignavibacteriaceae bacterium]
MESLKNKTIFITGASSGIGKACAELFASEGGNLILCARRIERLKKLSEDLSQKFGTHAHIVQLDVRNRKEVSEKISSIPNEFRNIDVLLNNAGLARGFDKIYEGNIDHWEEMIDTNIKGLLYVTRQILPKMIERKKGHIVNIGSTAGHEVYINGNVYCATKFAVNALTQAIRLDALDKNIRVSTVDPGMVLTEFSSVRFSGDEEKVKKVYEGVKPLSPKDIAETILFCITRPEHVSINEVIMTPSAQASSNFIYREKKS